MCHHYPTQLVSPFVYTVADFYIFEIATLHSFVHEIQHSLVTDDFNNLMTNDHKKGVKGGDNKDIMLPSVTVYVFASTGSLHGD